MRYKVLQSLIRIFMERNCFLSLQFSVFQYAIHSLVAIITIINYIYQVMPWSLAEQILDNKKPIAFFMTCITSNLYFWNLSHSRICILVINFHYKYFKLNQITTFVSTSCNFFNASFQFSYIYLQFTFYFKLYIFSFKSTYFIYLYCIYIYIYILIHNRKFTLA